MFLESSSDSSFLELDGLLQVETPTHEKAFHSRYILFAILHFAFAILTIGKYVHFLFLDRGECNLMLQCLIKPFLGLDECFSHFNVHANCLEILLIR